MVAIPTTHGDRLHARVFLIKLWLLVSEEEGGVQGLDQAGQGILGVSRPSAPSRMCLPSGLGRLIFQS